MKMIFRNSDKKSDLNDHKWLVDTQSPSITQQGLSGSEIEASTPKVCPLCLGDKDWENNQTCIVDTCPCCNGTGQVFL